MVKVLKHTKKNTATFVSHIDTMRILQRTLVRAGINVKMSEGFNPHPITYTSHPLPLGVTSEAEYFVIANEDLSTLEVLDRFNQNSPIGIKAMYCYELEKNPNLCAKVNYCEYYIESSEAIKYKSDIENYQNMDSYVISFAYKGGVKEQDIAPLIDSVSVSSSGISFVIATGNVNLRPDRLVEDFNVRFNLNLSVNDIVRVKQLIKQDNNFIDVDEFLKGLAK